MSYEKDGEKYYIVDAHCHFWDASRENWKPGREEYAKGWIDCFYGYHQLAPPETHWDYEKYLKVTPEDFEQDMFIEGYVDKVDLPVDLPLRLVHRGLQHRRPERRPQGPAAEVRRPVHRQRPVRPARRRGGPQAARRGRQEVEPEGRQGLHRRVVQDSRGWRLTARRPTASWRSARSWASRTSTPTRARRSGRWTRTPSAPSTSTRRRPTTRT